MIEFDKWIAIVKRFGKNYGKKVRITLVDGSVYNGVTDGYGEDEDSNGNNVWTITTKNRIFLQEHVENVEFLD